ncbi:MAG: ABC transporter permease [Candidatus Staskawiczbacteria bacterium]|nr:ABC transporter permease [Candidatus Staskawiczbacteria bacterium]
MLTNFKRIIKFAFTDFWRNKGISLAAVFVLVITIMLATGLFFFQGITKYLVSQVQDKIDITAYFKEDASEEDILKIRDEILKMSPDIKKIEYVSKEDALKVFTEKHKDNSVFSKALEEVGQNPFLPSLNITTTGSALQYEQISNILQTEDYSAFIDKVDFSQKKDTIEKVFAITSNINAFGLILGVILVIVAILVVFNTIKLAVESSKNEISTMRIVGASNWFIRGPFITQGAIYGLIAFIICFIFSILSTYFLSSKIGVILPGFNAFRYFLSNFWIFILIQLGFGIGLGIAASFIVVRKYLRI